MMRNLILKPKKNGLHLALLPSLLPRRVLDSPSLLRGNMVHHRMLQPICLPSFLLLLLVF
jgi:hypothetical protein